MKHVLVAGAGKIGALITCLLAESGDYFVYLGDRDFSGVDHKRLEGKVKHYQLIDFDVDDLPRAESIVKQHNIEAVISCLPFFCNVNLATLAAKCGLHYFDPTEDTEVTDTVKSIAKDATTAFVPQCGLAPGFVGLVANSLMRGFDELDIVKLRVGALPTNSSNALHYSLTWSTEGVINEYGNLCYGIANGKPSAMLPLEDLESIQIDGLGYEAFTTSGGLGSLAELYAGKVNSLDYKTIRYPGHCEKMRFLMNDLRLNDDRDTLKQILERVIPKTYQDVVLVYVSATGKKGGSLLEEHFVNKYYPQTIAGIDWSAIQVVTAAGVTAIVDMVMNSNGQYKGFIYQEEFELDAFMKNRFGQYYAIERGGQ